MDMDSGGKLVHGQLANHRREVASLTKMMTFYTAWALFKKSLHELPLKKASQGPTIMIKVPAHCVKIQGTSARLRKNDVLSLHDLFYAMLLPSGNDAALVLADHFGQLLQSKSEFQPPPLSS